MVACGLFLYIHIFKTLSFPQEVCLETQPLEVRIPPSKLCWLSYLDQGRGAIEVWGQTVQNAMFGRENVITAFGVSKWMLVPVGVKAGKGALYTPAPTSHAA